MLAIKSERIITPAGTQPGVVLIEAGRIVGITVTVPVNDCEVVDAGDSVVMPGVIDPHVHINEPGRTEWEGFETATKAAIAGGITTLVDMPLNSTPVTVSSAAFDEKMAAAEGKLHANCGFWGGVIPGNESEIIPLIEKGVLGFKAFLTHSGIDEFPNVHEADLRKVMPIIARYGLPLLVHCEIEMAAPRVTDPRSYDQYLQSRPRQWEDEAIKLIIKLCEEFGCRVHIVHLSSADSIEALAVARQQGLPLTVETAQHYLYFNAEDINDGDTLFKCAPPIRERENNQRLWGALRAGIIDFVASDHSPSPPEGKALSTGDFTRAWGGIAGLQLSLPALWTAGKKQGASIEDICKWLCENPTLLAGLNNKKGKLSAGYDADIVIWSPEDSFTVTEQSLQHKHGISPYVNEKLSGVVRQTFLRGQKVYNDGIITNPNNGELIKRSV